MLSADEAAFLDAWAACSSATTTVSVSSTPVSPVGSTTRNNHSCQRTAWSHDEHERFLEAMRLYPTGPWKTIAAHIGTRTPRQARTHAQKHKEKLHRRQRKLQRMQSYLIVGTTHSLAPQVAHRRQGIPWTPTEQDRLREGLQLYPNGPWRSIASHVGTRTIRQVMSFALKRRHELPIPSVQTSGNELPYAYPRLSESLDASALVSIDELFAEDVETQSGESDTDELLHRLLFVDEESGSSAVGPVASSHSQCTAEPTKNSLAVGATPH